MKYATSLLFVSAAYAAVVKRQLLPAPPPPPSPAGLLTAAGAGLTAAGEGLKDGGALTALPAELLESIGGGLSATGSALAGKGPKMARREPRQAVGDVGGLLSSALTSAGNGLQNAGKELGDSSIPGELIESIGSGLVSVGQQAKGSTGNPRFVAGIEKRQAPRPDQPANNSGGMSVKEGAAPTGLGTTIVEGVTSAAQGVANAAKSAKDSVGLARRQAPTPADVVASVGSSLEKGATAAGGLGSGVVASVGKGLESAAKGAKEASQPKMLQRQLAPWTRRQTSQTPATGDALGSLLNGAGGVTGAVADGLKSTPLTAPAGAIVEGVSAGLEAAAKGGKGKSTKRR